MLKLYVYLLSYIAFCGQPTFAQDQLLQFNTSLTFHSESFLGLHNNLRSSDTGISKFSIKYNTENSKSQLNLNYDGHNDFNLDESYFHFTKGIATYGVGAINRHWSFSDNTSLILSHNARPVRSIYLKVKNKFGYGWLSSKANWSFEAFNGFTEGSLNDNKSMLFGMRAILSPVEGLNFELIQTSQWGGDGYNNGMSSLGTVLFLDSNNRSNSNINKMAGFGISYFIPNDRMPLRIYGQAIGEDEAGNLPSCYAYLAGLEWSNSKFKYPIILNFEAIDTRIDKSTAGYCGPNTMYNNTIYDYTNYGKTMGAEIDTEGTSLGFYVHSQISQKINIGYSTKLVTINDSNWSGNRLSSNRQSGLINSLNISWLNDKISFDGSIYNQNFTLDKVGINSSYGFGLSSSIKF
jgi:hypothetical protein